MGSCACGAAEAETRGHVHAPAARMCVWTVFLSALTQPPRLMHIPQVVSSEKLLSYQPSLIAFKQPDESQDLWASSPKTRQLLGQGAVLALWWWDWCG